MHFGMKENHFLEPLMPLDLETNFARSFDRKLTEGKVSRADWI